MTVAHLDITPSYVRSILDYDPTTGMLTWKERPREFFKSVSAFKGWNKKYAGKSAGHIDKVAGYLVVGINNHPYSAHRIVWLWYYGEWPAAHIDHVNCDKADNRIANLRDASPAQNSGNSTQRRKNKSGWKGIVYIPKEKSYYAFIATQGKSTYLGTYKCPAAASFAYQIAADKKYGVFSRAFKETPKTNLDNLLGT